MAKRTARIGKLINPVLKVIEVGYGLPGAQGVMWFRVGAAPDTAEWKAMLEGIAEVDYGNFYGPLVVEILKVMQAELNMVEFGREYSPVLYLHADHKKIGPEKTFVQDVLDAFEDENMSPDESGWDKDRKCLRVWWD